MAVLLILKFYIHLLT